MKRLGIFVFYDREGIADDYIFYLLDGIKPVVDKLVIVVNGNIDNVYLERLYKYTDTIISRENLGFDAGAYKDALCKYIGWDNVCKFDELLLVNDTFYGPLYPFEDCFNKMEKMDVDYWGMTKSPKGVQEDGYAYDAHIQSYFLVLRKSVFSDNRFKEFWEKMPYPKSFLQAVRSFELECNKLLSECGWRGVALSDLYGFSFSEKVNCNPYMSYSYELIHDAKIPVLKCKSLDMRFSGFSNAFKAFKYMEDQEIYDVGLIKKRLMRIGQPLHERAKLDFSKLSEFYYAHAKIYLYGAGTCGKNLAEYFDYKGWSFEGFLVSDIGNQGEKRLFFDDADISDNDGIIIAVGTEQAYIEIRSIIEKRCNREQIYP
ncbi:MAG: hypothetical protein NC313_03920 [Butyrivibrio sp.]|nr:hypothetical protein [Butyrivibrio sp.]